MDENNIYMIFDIKLNKSLIENINSIQIQNLIIVNEKNDIIYCENSEAYNKFYESHKYLQKTLEYNINNTLTFKFNKYFIEKSDNYIKYVSTKFLIHTTTTLF